MRKSWAGMDRDLLIARSMKGLANSSEPEDHGHLCKTGHYRPWDKIILSHFSALTAGHCHLTVLLGLSRARVSLGTSSHGSSAGPSLVSPVTLKWVTA